MKLTNPRLTSIRALAVAMFALALGACGGGAAPRYWLSVRTW